MYDIKLVYMRELPDPITFDVAAVDLFAGETFIPKRTGGSAAAVTASSSNTAVATVDATTHKITAVAPGRAVITMKQPSTGAEATINVNVLNVNNLCHNLSSSEIYASGVKLSYGFTVMQGFDMNPDDGYMYFTQVGGSSNYYANHLSRRTLTETKVHDSGLKLPYFGHGQGLAVETDGGTTYCWLGCHGTHCDDDVYRYSQTIGRFPYKTGTLLTSECEEYYWIPDRCHLQISLDKPNDMAMIYCLSLDLSKAYMYGYRLSQMKAISPSKVTLPMQRRFGGPGENQPTEIKEYTIVNAKNLSAITPVFGFELSPQCRDSQGYVYKNGKIFITTGCPEDIVEDQSWNNKWTVFVLNTSGTVQKTLVLDSYISENLVKSVLGHNLGYFEPEGFQMYDGCLYQGFASRNNEGGDMAVRIPVIMKYDLAK